jgi:hypothetical protein
MKFYHSLGMHTNKLQNRFQLDMWKRNEIIRKNPERTERQTDRHHCTIIRDVLSRGKSQFI